MPHPLLLALFQDRTTAAEAASRLRQAGLAREDLSVVAATHHFENALARELEVTPGAEIEDSRPAGRLGEISAHVLAAIAVVLPGVGSIVTAGPLAADLGEAAGHAAGRRIASILEDAGLSSEQASRWESAVGNGALLIGAHVRHGDAETVRRIQLEAGATDLIEASWQQ
jgi:hypothetical protein